MSRIEPATIRSLPTPRLLELLGVNQEFGLSSETAKAKLSEIGWNEIPEKRKNPFWSFLKRFWGPSAWMLEAIGAISLILRKPADFYLASGLLLTNALIGFFQERRSSQVVKMLQSKLRVQTRVLRDGSWGDVPARELAPGDVVRLRMGDLVPADLRIINGDVLVDQSSLTGESLEQPKTAGDELFSSSIVRQGEVLGVVTFTGPATYFGRTVELVQGSQPKLHVEEVVSKMVGWLLVIVGSVVALLLALAAFRGTPMADVLPLSLVLLMGAVPVALPVMFTVSTALGARDLGKKGVLVTRLSATEDAATMQVLFADKTGTMTLNQLVVAGLYPEEGTSPEELLLCAALASNESNRDSIDAAVLADARRKSLSFERFRQTSFVPFSPRTRKTEAWVEGSEGSFKAVKGALQAVASAANLGADDVRRLETRADLLAEKGCRTLGVARIAGDKPSFLGLVALYDPDKYKAAKALQDAGVVVGMTGDGVNDAPALNAAEVGIAVKGATDAARGAASVVLTDAGLSEIVDLVENGRSVYQRILTWIINKVSRTVLKTGFVGLAFIFTGHLLISASGMLVLVFMTDFVKITLASDRVRPSRTPDTWEIRPLVAIAVVLGMFMVFESLGILWVGWRFAGVPLDSRELHTFSFLILLFMAIFSILCIRERGPFWKSPPSVPLGLAMLLDGAAGLLIGWKGVGVLPPLRPSAAAVALVGSLSLSLVFNDLIKLALFRFAGTVSPDKGR
ncbi:MAG: HAD-IC family P-type ATPase [Nitrospinae bacterium]|nr:HAD-IC family P-type ATPase [Nitrospinota bacterium]